MQEFLDRSLPGTLATDIVTTMVWLMTSKNPDQLIRAMVSSDNMYARYPKNLVGLRLPAAAPKAISIFELMLNSTAKLYYEKRALSAIGNYQESVL
jgi:hypothetical protein